MMSYFPAAPKRWNELAGDIIYIIDIYIYIYIYIFKKIITNDLLPYYNIDKPPNSEYISDNIILLFIKIKDFLNVFL